MLKFTIVKGNLVLDPNIVLIKELHDLFKVKDGSKLLQMIYYRHSTDVENPFRDLDARVLEENILRLVFNKNSWSALKLTADSRKKFEKAEEAFLLFNSTPELRLLKSVNAKMDQIAKMLDDNDPVIEESVTNSGETKFNTNLTIMLAAFTKIETIIKSKTILNNAILKAEASGKVRGGGTTSFREMGMLKNKED